MELNYIKLLNCKMRKLGIISDFLLKISANIIQIVFKNLILLPYFASIMTVYEYGTFIVLISIAGVVCSTFGNSLTSTRLILEEKYAEYNIQGDFNILCCLVSCIGCIGCVLLPLIFSDLNIKDILLLSLIVLLEIFLAYNSGWFVLKQAYKQLLVYTIIGGLGLVIGLCITKFSKTWQFTYITSDILLMGYILKCSPLIREKFIISSLFNDTIKKYVILVVATIITSSLAYLDRFVLYPIIGEHAVAVFAVACAFGKSYSLISSPISSVMLGYFASGKVRLSLGRFITMNIVIIFALLLFFILISFAGKWVTGFLYPSLIDFANPFIIIANMSSAIVASSELLRAVALKYVNTYIVLFAQLMYGLVYIVLGYSFAKYDGLQGFANAALLSSLFNYSIFFLICFFSLKFKEVKI